MRTDLYKWTPPERIEPGMLWPEKTIGQAVLAVYRDCVDPSYTIENLREEDDSNVRSVRAVLATAAGRRLALEIKALQAFPQQFRSQSLARDILQPIEDDLATRVRRGITCELPTEPLIGPKWQCLRTVLPRYIQTVANELPAGISRHQVEGVPFTVVLSYDPWLALPFHFTRALPGNGAAAELLLKDVEQALTHKRLSLLEHSAAGDRTVLALVVPYPFHVALHRLDEAFSDAAQRLGASHLADVIVLFSDECEQLSCIALRSRDGLAEKLNPLSMAALAGRREH